MSLLVRFCWLLQHVCCRVDSVRCFNMSVVDLVLLVVSTCLLLIRFCSLLRHLTWPRQYRHGHAQSHTSGPSNGQLFGLKKSTAVPHNGIETIHHFDRQPVCCGVFVGCRSMSGISVDFCGMSIVDSILFVVMASHVAASISAWSCAITHQWVIQWATVLSQKVDSGSA
jgi:hypothetical protein